MPELSGLSVVPGMPRASTASLLAGWFLASSLGGLRSILVSRLELSSASRLWAAALSVAVGSELLSGAVLSVESCASERLVTSAKKNIRQRIRTSLLYRLCDGETGVIARRQV